jgi:hypothetical protein
MLIDNNLKFGTLVERTSKQSGMPGTHKNLNLTKIGAPIFEG